MHDLLALAFALAVPATLCALLWRWARGPLTLRGVRAEPDRPRDFGYKTSWLAVRADDPHVLLEALRSADPRFRDATPCNWESGFARVFGAPMSRGVFVTPSVDGWVLAFGYYPPAHPASNRTGEGPRALASLERLGAALGRPLWFFGSHRGVGYVDWAAVQDGRVRRAYSHADGRTFYDVGEPPPEERALGLRFFGAADAEEDDDEHLPDEATVVTLATKWTLDPRTLSQIAGPSVGTLVRLR